MCKKRRVLQRGSGRRPRPAAKGEDAGRRREKAETPAPPAADGQGGSKIFFTPVHSVQNAPPFCEKSECVLCAEGGVLGRNKFCRQIALPFCRRCAIISKNSAALQGQGSEKILPPADQAVQNAPVRGCAKPPAREKGAGAACNSIGEKAARKRQGAKRKRQGAKYRSQTAGRRKI